MRAIDIAGQRFGMLTAIARAGSVKNTNRSDTVWLCRCECGKEVIVRTQALTSGNTKSCGCARKAKRGGYKHGACKSRLYHIWSGMLQRCYYKGRRDYHNYGGRGIKVCEEWRHDFSKFREWALENGYTDALSIDRIDVDGNYEPTNCRWATSLEQAHNKRNSRGNGQ